MTPEEGKQFSYGLVMGFVFIMGWGWLFGKYISHWPQWLQMSIPIFIILSLVFISA